MNHETTIGESETPLTDAQLTAQTLPQAMGYVPADFARDLERKLAETQAAIDLLVDITRNDGHTRITLEGERDQSRDEVNELRTALETAKHFMRHDQDCRDALQPRKPCTCGLDGAMHLVGEALRGESIKPSVFEAVKFMESLSDEQRMEVAGNFCRACGGDDPRCQCWNDE